MLVPKLSSKADGCYLKSPVHVLAKFPSVPVSPTSASAGAAEGISTGTL